jgi:KaiC/GvpD/RAD55 family RecA-like ATPase
MSTGNPGLDAMLEGGLVPHRPYLIVGPAGTGKTTLALQFLAEGARKGERTLLVTLEEPPNEARVNHRALQPHLDGVDVFDAIPDIMRYERVPFKDIASVRSAVPFAQVPAEIRRTPELTSVEVTITALEQMLRTEVLRRNYTRLVIDSLTALQYFCMKGFDPVAGAQTFLRFLSDLHVTTLLTVESPLEDADTAERMLARGEIRLFRWELDGLTVRAIGVEKFRGSPHDVRLHPYRIGPRGIDINLDVTISRDTRQIIEPLVPVVEVPTTVPAPPEAPSLLDPLSEEVADLVLVGVDVEPVRTEVEEALGALTAGVPDETQAHLTRATGLSVGLAESLLASAGRAAPSSPAAERAFERIRQRSETARIGTAPTDLPPARLLEGQLKRLLATIDAARAEVAPPPAPAPLPPPVSEVPAPSASLRPPVPTVSSPVAPEPPAGSSPAEPAVVPEVPPPLPQVPVEPVAREVPVSEPTVSPPLPEPAPPIAPALLPPPTVAASSAAIAPGVATSPEPAPPKRRRRVAPPKKKPGKEATAPLAEVPPGASAAPELPPSLPSDAPPPAPTGPSLETAPAADAAAKPKRRVSRKRKAPTVVAAAVVSIPPGALGGNDPPPPPSPDEKTEPEGG